MRAPDTISSADLFDALAKRATSHNCSREVFDLLQDLAWQMENERDLALRSEESVGNNDPECGSW